MGRVWGLTDIPDRDLFSAIEGFQGANGLRVDGVMNPKGETEQASQLIQASAFLPRTKSPRGSAQRLQNMGRHGDTILAHITPSEALLLKRKGGAGSINPDTGLLEFFEADTKKEGQYIWRTAGDDRVRQSHADRDGKTFSWDAPPEGGHPGEADYCRCEAEDVKVDTKKCKDLKHKMDNQIIAVQEAERDWARIQKELENSSMLQRNLQDKCDNSFLKSGGKIIEGAGAGWVRGGPAGAMWGGGKATILSGGDVYDACSAADSQMEKVDELKMREKSALTWMNDQRALLKDLRKESANAGCKS